MKYIALEYTRSYLLKLAWLLVAVITAGCIYAFYVSEIEMGNFIFVNPFYEWIHAMPWWIYMVIWFIIISVLGVLLFISLSLYYSFVRNKLSILRDRYYRFFTNLLTHYFLSNHYSGEEGRQKLVRTLKPHLKNRTQTIAFIEAFLNIQETLTNELGSDFNWLMQELKIEKQALVLIHSRSFDNKILAMKLIAYLGVSAYSKYIVKYAQSKNEAVRTEAYASLIKLMATDKNLVSLIKDNDDLSLIDVNIIVNAALKNPAIDMNDDSWFLSKNPRLMIVSLLLTKYGYRNKKSNFTPILNHTSGEEKEFSKLAWEVLLLRTPEEELVTIITDCFEQEREDVKLLIIKASQNISDKRFLDFLERIIETQPLLVKIEILSLFFKHDFDRLTHFINSDNDELNMAYKEATSLLTIN